MEIEREGGGGEHTDGNLERRAAGVRLYIRRPWRKGAELAGNILIHIT